MKPSITFKPIPLADGRLIASLAQARHFMRWLPENAAAQAHWKYARDLFLRADDRREKYATGDARAQMSRALKIGGFM
jgi:hypothetical protein